MRLSLPQCARSHLHDHVVMQSFASFIAIEYSHLCPGLHHQCRRLCDFTLRVIRAPVGGGACSCLLTTVRSRRIVYVQVGKRDQTVFLQTDVRQDFLLHASHCDCLVFSVLFVCFGSSWTLWASVATYSSSVVLISHQSVLSFLILALSLVFKLHSIRVGSRVAIFFLAYICSFPSS